MRVLLLGLTFLVGNWAMQCHASLVVWSIDSIDSYVRLNIPDQNVPINENDPPDTINAMLRDYQVNGGPVFTGDPDVPMAWTDTNGRRSFVQGSLTSNYLEGSNIQFGGGTHSAGAIEYGEFRPDPIPVPGTGPAAFAGDVWGFEEVDPDNNPGFFAFARLGHVRIRNINYDLDGTANLTEGPAGTWTQTSGAIDLGILAGAVVDVDLAGLLTEFGLTLDPFSDDNQGSLVVENIGGLNRRLTINVDVPLTFDLQGIALSASISGQIVAYSTVPEPASMSLAGVAIGLSVLRRRRVIR